MVARDRFISLEPLIRFVFPETGIFGLLQSRVQVACCWCFFRFGEGKRRKESVVRTVSRSDWIRRERSWENFEELEIEHEIIIILDK